jgi:hypothetical protein
VYCTLLKLLPLCTNTRLSPSKEGTDDDLAQVFITLRLLVFSGTSRSHAFRKSPVSINLSFFNRSTINYRLAIIFSYPTPKRFLGFICLCSTTVRVIYGITGHSPNNRSSSTDSTSSSFTKCCKLMHNIRITP